MDNFIVSKKIKLAHRSKENPVIRRTMSDRRNCLIEPTTSAGESSTTVSTDGLNQVKKSNTKNVNLPKTSNLLNELAILNSAKSQINFREIVEKDLHLSYCETFLPKALADSLFDYCEGNITYVDNAQVRVYGKWHTVKRKQVAFGDKGIQYGFSGSKLTTEEWSKELDELRRYVSEVSGDQFNYVLVNRYADGNDCIGEHRDREAELDPAACIASLSLGQCRDFVLRHENVVRQRELYKQSMSSEPVLPANVKLQLRHGSLLLMRPPTNIHWYHSLPPRKRIVGTRINFTFRKMR